MGFNKNIFSFFKFLLKFIFKIFKKIFILIFIIFDSIKLNLGIKKTIKKIVNRFYNNLYLFIFKKIYPPLYSKINYIFAKEVISYYGADYKWNDESSHRISKKTGNLGFGLIFYSFIKVIRPKRVLVIGSMYGFIPFMGALALKENKIGQLDFVDPGYDINDPINFKNHNMGQGVWKKVNIKEYFSFLGVENKINHYLMTSEEFAKKYPSRKYDIIWLDGDHSLKGTMLDFKYFWPKINNNGFLFIHDIMLNEEFEGTKFETAKAWKKFIKKINYKFYIESSSGLGVLQKSK